MSLLATIQSITERLRGNRYRNETDVREGVVIRILSALGWDIYDPDTVRREFTLERRRVDYALFTNPTSPSVLIEVKAPNATTDGDRQLFEYAFHQGAPFAILVDGREWSFFLPAEQGNYSERRVQKLDLLAREPSDSCQVFERYLKAERVKNGSAFQDARSDYQSAARSRAALDAIPRAWNELRSEPDELLIELIAERVEKFLGFRPTYEQVEAYLLNLGTATIEAGTRPAAPSPIQSHRNSPVTLPTVKGSRRVSVVFKGETSEHADGISALIYILKKLDDANPQFLDEFAMAAPGRRRNHISKARSKVYPDKPELEIYTTNALGKGWWLGTNIANREKERLIKIACDVSRLKFGKDIRIDLPNATD